MSGEMIMAEKFSKKSTVRIMNINPHCEPGGGLINSIAMFLQVNGYKVVFGHTDTCDIVLINSCAVRNWEIAATKLVIDKALHEKTVKKVIVYGCFHAFTNEKDWDARVLIVKPKELNKFNELFPHRTMIEKVSAGLMDKRLFVSSETLINAEDWFVVICQGCLQNCSYCNTRIAKGKVLSRPYSEIIANIKRGIAHGKRTVALVADDCGSYGIDIKSDLSCLISDILRECPEVSLKISALFPGRLIALYPMLRTGIASGKITYVSVPVQSGSGRILKLMNRDYDPPRVKEILKDMRKLAPRMFLYTHIIVNFPTETLEDLQASLRAAILFDDFEIVNYSDNPLTAAHKIAPQVEQHERERRLKFCGDFVDRRRSGNVRLVSTQNKNKWV